MIRDQRDSNWSGLLLMDLSYTGITFVMILLDKSKLIF
jgi:hypothetical protein